MHPRKSLDGTKYCGITEESSARRFREGNGLGGWRGKGKPSWMGKEMGISPLSCR